MNENFEKHYNYLTEFIDNCIKYERLSHSIIFEGSDILTQYSIALEIARKLNCIETQEYECSCRNCQWIRDNKHPAVVTISKIDNKTDNSTSVISVEQVNTILNTLIHPSEFKRVYIFCDAEIKQLTKIEEKRYQHFEELNLRTPQNETTKTKWYPEGLTEKCFQIYTQNAMLKSIEEPPENVTFIFLTKNKNDLLPTIVSRSQSFYVPSYEIIEYDTSFFETELKNYPQFTKDEAFRFVKNIISYQNENEFHSVYILDCLQEYLKKILKSNLTNKYLTSKIYKDINKIETSKKMLYAYIKDTIIFEDIAFYLAK